MLVLHGGAEVNADPVTWGHKPWLRARLLGLQVGPALRRTGLDVWLLRYREIGWNAESSDPPSPVQDARWALDRVRESHPEPGSVVVVGHSMGARTGVAVAGDPLVRGVVGLAPWFPLGEPVEPLAGKHLVAAHGRADTVTKYAETEAFVRRASGVAASAELVDMGDLGHTMMDGLGRWNALTRERVLDFFA